MCLHEYQVHLIIFFRNNSVEHYLKQVKDGTVWKRDKSIKWQCLVCGYVYEGTEPPKVCPACDHPREHYMGMDYEL